MVVHFFVVFRFVLLVCLSFWCCWGYFTKSKQNINYCRFGDPFYIQETVDSSENFILSVCWGEKNHPAGNIIQCGEHTVMTLIIENVMGLIKSRHLPQRLSW